ncbi:hypothetical protein PoB_002608400 [Plakobranchus ocellatus]|uniref:Uncharacterized protein n=1 Tax=Plakobranchus ocellatus TaxID=259542 RepID=A0AAV4A046_9GAST|nr:hypothetical protein PoB_002608400 [Plakobranchus ocellatus]
MGFCITHNLTAHSIRSPYLGPKVIMSAIVAKVYIVVTLHRHVSRLTSGNDQHYRERSKLSVTTEQEINALSLGCHFPAVPLIHHSFQSSGAWRLDQ